MGLEEELQRVLQTKSIAPGGEDPVASVHRGMRRRRRRQRLTASGAALSVMLAAVLGGLLLTRGSNPTTPQPLRPVITSYDITKVPAGFQIRDLSFLSTTDGYALGTSSCYPGIGRAPKSCTVLLHTADAGSSWSRQAAPLGATVVEPGPLPATCSTGTCVSHLRFALDPHKRQVGYAYGPGLVMTTDGLTWTSVPTPSPVEALEAAGGSVIRVLAKPGGGHVVQRAVVGTDVWTDVYTVDAPTFNALLSRQGDRLVLVTYDNNTGPHAESDVSDIRTSADGGTTWDKAAHNPCDTDALTDAVALASDKQMLVLCTRRSGKLASSYVRRSTDEGRTFGKPIDLPLGYAGTQIAAPALHGWFVAADHVGTSKRSLLVSSDKGTTWQAALVQPVGTGLLSGGYLDISNSKTLTWVGPNARDLYRTGDAGKDWNRYSFR